MADQMYRQKCSACQRVHLIHLGKSHLMTHFWVIAHDSLFFYGFRLIYRNRNRWLIKCNDKNVQHVKGDIEYMWVKVIRWVIFELLTLIRYFFTVFDLYLENHNRWLIKYLTKMFSMSRATFNTFGSKSFDDSFLSKYRWFDIFLQFFFN